MEELLSQIQTVLQLALAAITLGLTIWLAPGEAMSWFKKILVLNIFLQVIGLFVPSLYNVKVFVLYWMNLTFYQLMPKSFWELFTQMAVMVLTYNILLYAFKSGSVSNVAEDQVSDYRSHR